MTSKGVAVEVESAISGPTRGADRAVLLAHGAGADMNAVTLTAFSDVLAQHNIATMRFNFAYRAAGKGAPPKAPVLMEEVRRARDTLAKRCKLPADRIVLGGRSMGGRICSMVASEDGALGMLLLGYPLHPPGKPETLRVEHFPNLAMAVMFISGTRDTFGTPDELTHHGRSIPGPVDHYWIETADHGFRPLKKQTRLTTEQALIPAAQAAAAWVAQLS